MQLKDFKLYFLLFRISFSISAFTFGGGYIVIPMIRRHFVDNLKLISEQELLDMAAIAQSTPGAIAVNIAVLVGYRIGGIGGAIICGIGTILPPIILLSIISSGYSSFRANRLISATLKGMEAGIAAAIVDLVIDMCNIIVKEKNWLLTLMVPASFFVTFFLNMNVIYVIISCAILSFIQSYLDNKNSEGELGCG